MTVKQKVEYDVFKEYLLRRVSSMKEWRIRSFYRGYIRSDQTMKQYIEEGFME